MSELIGSDFIIQQTPPEFCELCGKFDELRPYGPNGERICFDCGQKNEPVTSQRIKALLDKAQRCVLLPPS